MHTYRVVECRAHEGRLALQCSAGRYHVTRALGALPSLGATLNGAKPHLGFGVLLCPKSGEMFRVIFESIHVTDLALDEVWNQATRSHQQDAGRGMSG